VDEPGADLAVALALASAHRGEPLRGPEGKPLACFGEVGLTGELRFVPHPERRTAEALKFGLGAVVGPAAADAIAGLEGKRTVSEALRRGLAPRRIRKAA
jgi:DNA repair protein RadA/Sms